MVNTSLVTVHKRCLLLFPDSLCACLLAPLLVGMWTMAKLVHYSVVVAPVREGGLLGLATRGCMVNQGRAENPSSMCWRQGSQSHLYWALLHTRHLLAFHCIFIHPWNSTASLSWRHYHVSWLGWVVLGCRTHNKNEGQCLSLMMWWTPWNVHRSSPIGGATYSLDFPYLKGGRNDNTHNVL